MQVLSLSVSALLLLLSHVQPLKAHVWWPVSPYSPRPPREVSPRSLVVDMSADTSECHLSSRSTYGSARHGRRAIAPLACRYYYLGKNLL